MSLLEVFSPDAAALQQGRGSLRADHTNFARDLAHVIELSHPTEHDYCLDAKQEADWIPSPNLYTL